MKIMKFCLNILKLTSLIYESDSEQTVEDGRDKENATVPEPYYIGYETFNLGNVQHFILLCLT